MLKAPFPWFGGKRRVADLVWPRFGDTLNYVEPFAGSLAVLLARPTDARTETVNDKDARVVWTYGTPGWSEIDLENVEDGNE